MLPFWIPPGRRITWEMGGSRPLSFFVVCILYPIHRVMVNWDPPTPQDGMEAGAGSDDPTMT